MRLLGRILLYLLATIGGLAIAGVVAIAILAVSFAPRTPSLPDRIVLILDLHPGVVERGPSRLLQFLGAEPTVLRDAVDALTIAREDDRVVALMIRLGGVPVAIAHAQELRDAIAAFRAKGKFSIAFAESFGLLGNGTPEYYLASVAEEVWMQPSGQLGLTGLAVEMPFLRGTLDKLGIKPRIERRHEYKSSAEMFTRAGFSEPARRSLQRLADSWLMQITTGIAADRGLTETAVHTLVNNGPYLAAEARDARLIDRLGYDVQAWDRARVLAGPDASRVTISDYRAATGRPHSEGVKVALIFGVGAIELTTEGENPLFEGDVFAAWTVRRAIYDAIADEEIEAILLRVDSPGGSYVASDTVWAALKRARDSGKPVVVSMSDVAASGGYFVAMDADRIIAQPGTVTGSIGVFGGKFVTERFWEKLGITWDEVHAGERALMWSEVRDYPPGAEARLSAMIDSVYADFTAKAASGRGLTAAQIDAAARGRIWTGEDALEMKLIDALGGYEAAVAAVKELLGLAPEDGIELVPLPHPRTPVERLIDAMSSGYSLDAALSEAFELPSPTAALRHELEPLLGDLSALRPPRGILQIPPFRLQR